MYLYWRCKLNKTPLSCDYLYIEVKVSEISFTATTLDNIIYLT